MSLTKTKAKPKLFSFAILFHAPKTFLLLRFFFATFNEACKRDGNQDSRREYNGNGKENQFLNVAQALQRLFEVLEFSTNARLFSARSGAIGFFAQILGAGERFESGNQSEQFGRRILDRSNKAVHIRVYLAVNFFERAFQLF